MRKGFAVPLLIFFILIILLGAFGWKKYDSLKGQTARKDDELKELKEQIEELRKDYREASASVDSSTRVELLDISSIRSKSYNLDCRSPSRGDKPFEISNDLPKDSHEELVSVCFNRDLKKYIYITFQKTGTVTAGPYYGIFQFRIANDNVENVVLVGKDNGGLYSWCAEIVYWTKENQLFYYCSEGLRKLTLKS